MRILKEETVTNDYKSNYGKTSHSIIAIKLQLYTSLLIGSVKLAA